MDSKDDLTFREVASSDLDAILHHRKQMFIDMGHKDDEKMAASMQTSSEFFALALAEGRYKGWFAQTSDGRIVAGGGVIISTRPSHPSHPGLCRADILNMYTEPPFRRLGIARQLMHLMIAWCRQAGFEWVTLHASNDGRKLYESLGFRQTTEMRLDLR